MAAMVDGFGSPASLHFLPDARDVVDRALVAGHTLVESAPDAPLVRALAELAAALRPDGAPVRPRRVRWRRAARARRR